MELSGDSCRFFGGAREGGLGRVSVRRLLKAESGTWWWWSWFFYRVICSSVSLRCEMTDFAGWAVGEDEKSDLGGWWWLKWLSFSSLC